MANHFSGRRQRFTKLTKSTTGRWGEATYRLHMGMGTYMTVQTRGWMFSRKEVEARYGRLTNGEFESVMRRYSELRAEQLQAEVVDMLEQTRIPDRKSVSTQRLAAALLHPKNRIIRPFGFGVGVPSWLNRSQAKYWRQIDQGFTGHVGRAILITGQEGKPLQSIRYRKGGAEGSFASSPRRWVAGRPGTLGQAQNEKTRGIIRNPIEPQRYFKKAWEATSIRELVLRDLDQAIYDVLGF